MKEVDEFEKNRRYEGIKVLKVSTKWNSLGLGTKLMDY